MVFDVISLIIVKLEVVVTTSYSFEEPLRGKRS